MKTCTIDGCNRRYRAKGYCAKHYHKIKGYKRPLAEKKDYGICIIDECDIHAGPTGACRKHWHRVNSPDKSFFATLRKFNLTLVEYNDMLIKQHGRCKTCKSESPGRKKVKFAIDHDHSCCPSGVSCGKCIRGLLCSRCNLGLGYARDSVLILQSMIEYLETHETLSY